MIYGEKGEILKAFDVKDGLGIKLLLKYIDVAIISGNKSGAIEARAKILGIKHCHIGIENKKDCIDQLQKKLKVEKRKTVFIGDDLNDLTVRECVGLFCCPRDAHSFVKRKSDLILKHKGGDGAVREFCDLYLLAIKKALPFYIEGFEGLNA